MRNALALAAIMVRLVGNSDLQPLEVKKPVERKLDDGDLHQYRLPLRERTFVRLQLMRQAVEVRVIVWGPKGEKLRESSSLNEAIGPLPLLFVGEQSGEYRVGVQANGAGSSSGRYRIQLDELRPSRAEDRDRVLAFDDYAKAEELTARATAASQRQATPLFEEAAQAARRAGELELEAAALDHLALVYRNLSDGNKALDYLNQALDRWRRLKHRQGEAHALSIMGGVYTMQGLIDEALDAHRRALELERAAGASAELGPHLNNVGMAYQQLGDPLKAIPHYEEALSLFRASHKTLAEGVTLHNICTARQLMGELQQAIECYQQALEILHTAGNPRREALT